MPRRRRRVSRLQLFYSAVIVAIMAIPSLALDRAGAVVTAQVASLRERIVVGFEPSGEWDRYYEVTAALRGPDGARWEPVLRVPAARYDALRIGDSITVRYLRQFPAMARTTDRSTATVIREFVRALAGLPIVVWLVAGVVGFWIAARLSTAAVIVMAVGWALAAWPMFFMPPSREGTRTVQRMAEVRRITLVDKSPARLSNSRRGPRFNRRLAVPYQVVELAVAAAGLDTVLAVDAVDSGSVAGLAPGALLPVRLAPASPRDAQLVGGTRRFAMENRYHFFVPVTGCVLLAAFAAFGYRWRRRPPEGRSPAGPEFTDSRAPWPNDHRISLEGGA